MKEKNIAILIPCYNEEKSIKKVINDFQNQLPNAKIYVYDNNSSDNTNLVAKKEGAIVRYEKRQGKGNVIRTMFKEIDADCYLIVDGDNTYSAKHAREMCNYVLNEDFDMVIGDRLSSTYFKENKRKFHNFGNKLVRKLINKLFKSNIHDVMTGYRAFSYEFVKTFPVISKGFEIETEMTIHLLDKNLLFKEIPIEYKDRLPGSISKLNTIKDGTKVIKTIVKLFKEYKPKIFFNVISSFFFLISLILMVPIFVEYFKTGLVPRFPTLIFSGFLLIISIVLLACGIILDVIVNKHRQLFEYLYINTKRK